MVAKKYLNLIIITVILVGSTFFSNNVWAQAPTDTTKLVSDPIYPPQAIELGPYGGTISDLKVDPKTPATLYAASNYGVFKSINNGDHWSGTGLIGVTVYSLAVDPVNPANVYAGSRGQGFYRSNDGGTTWTSSTSQIMADKIIYTIGVDPINPKNLYAGGRAANVDGTTTNEWGGGVFKSTDAGITWQAINTNLPEGWVYSLVIDPQTPATIYAGTHSMGVFKSYDGGASWQAKNGGLVSAQFNYTEDLKIRSLAINPQDPKNLLVGVWGGASVFQSTDGAEGNWHFAGKALGLAKIRTVAFNPITPNVVYAGKDSGGLFHNESGGPDSQWRSYAGDWSNFSLINAITINPTNGFVFLGVQGAGVIRSTDGGATWQVDNQGLAATTISTIANDPFNSNNLYAATNGTGVFKSADKGITWSNFSWPGTWDWAQNIAVDPQTPGVLYVATGNSGIGVSHDSGISWTPINNNLPASTPPIIYSLQTLDETGQVPNLSNATPQTLWVTVSPTTPAITLYVGTNGNGIYQSKDAGHSWKHIDNYGEVVTSIIVYPNDPKSVLVSTANLGVVRITNDGAAFTTSQSGLPSADVLSVLIDPTTSTTAYVGTPNGIYISTNAGVTWSLLGLPNDGINAMAIDPAQKTTLYAGTQVDGVMKSTDSGHTWYQAAMPGTEVDALLPGSSSHNIYAGVNGGGVIDLEYSTFITNVFIKIIKPTH